MAREKLIAGNWKMNTTVEEAAALAKTLVDAVKDVPNDRKILVSVPFVSITRVVEAAKDANIMVGAQNMHFEDKGAYTGEISAEMLLSAGATHVILGHSERRELFGETDETINKKVKKALEKGLTPVFCIGEKLEEREAGKANAVVETQTKAGLQGISAADAKKVVIAYEPVWAIGTGKTATPEDADAMHLHIRKTLAEMYSASVAEEAIILYGGSMNDKNADDLLNMPNIDGGLIGGASLKADAFSRIAHYIAK